MSKDELARVALRLAAMFDQQEREDGRIGGAVTAYRAGVGMTIHFWNRMALAAMPTPIAESEALATQPDQARTQAIVDGEHSALTEMVALDEELGLYDTEEKVVPSDLVARIDYILDPAASESERTHRRLCLTNHDLRTLRALATQQPLEADVVGVIERLRLHASWRDSQGELNSAPNEAADMLARLSSQGGASNG